MDRARRIEDTRKDSRYIVSGRERFQSQMTEGGKRGQTSGEQAGRTSVAATRIYLPEKAAIC